MTALLNQALQSIQLILQNKQYHQILVFLAVFLSLMLLLTLARSRRKQLSLADQANAGTHTLTNKDFESMAGDDVVTTQLDLARAYIEMGKKHLAKSILFNVTKQGKADQQQEARQLLNSL
jgi:FimV-like protein